MNACLRLVGVWSKTNEQRQPQNNTSKTQIERHNMSQDTHSTDNQMNGETLDVAEQRKRELQQLFPSAFTETVNDKGELVSSIDFERLKAELGEFSDVFEGRREKYGMDWPGKRDALRLVQEPSRATLKPCREESVDFDTTENLFIEGDNLEVLKLLQKSYYGKVKMIYIDPPYNTGKEFIYPDKYSESLDTYLSYAGLVDDEGRKFTTNTATEGRFHTKWLNMMYPRLYLARNLLRDDGVIFISIDEHEVENLRRMCDEIFGEENFIAQVVWKNATDNNPTNIAVEHEYLIACAKSKADIETVWRSSVSDIKDLIIQKSNKFINENSNIDGASKAYTAWFKENKSQLWPLDGYKNLDDGGAFAGIRGVHNPGKEGYRYDVLHPVTNKPCKEPLMGYRFPFETLEKLLRDDRIIFGEDHSKLIELKAYASDYQEKFSSVIEIDSRSGAYDVRGLFPEYKKVFDNPKPIRFLNSFLPFMAKGDDCIVLDFFAGSASTAHALFELNVKNGLHNNFIMVQLPERCNENSEPYRNGEKIISNLSKERVRRAASKITEKNPSYTGDLGFKVLKLDQSNFKQWQAPERNASDDDLIQQMELHIDHLEDAADPEAILYELLLKAGFMPIEKVETLILSGKSVYSIADGALLVYLEDQIDNGLIQAVADAEPAQFICLDKAFGGNDQLKANAVQTFKALNQSREVKIEFRTV